jgi:hydrogenase maturation protease
MMISKILIAGVGNLLFTDEGIGVHAVRELSRRQLDSNVELIELGTSTFDLPVLMGRKERVIIIDAILSDDPPGSVLRLTPSDLKSGTRRTLTSVHELGVPEAVATARKMGFKGEVVVLGAVPKDYKTPSMQLTPELSQTLPTLIEAILAELEP